MRLFSKGRGLLGAAAAALAGVVVLARRSGSSSPAVPEPSAPGGGPPLALPDLLQRSRSKLSGVRSELRPLVEQMIANAFETERIALVVTDGFRSAAQQDALYEQGRTRPGAIVTHLRGGQSWHNYGLAVDVAVLAGGKLTWPNDDDLWLQIGAIGKVLGLRWGGDFPKFKDRPHFELRLPGIGPGISPPPGPIA